MASTVKKLRGFVWLEHLRNEYGLDAGSINKGFCANSHGDKSALPYKWRAGKVSPSPITAKRFSEKFPGSWEVYEAPIFGVLEMNKRKKISRQVVYLWLEKHQPNASGLDLIFIESILYGFRHRKPESILLLEHKGICADFIKNYSLFALTAVLALLKKIENCSGFEAQRGRLVNLTFELLPALKNNRDFYPHYDLLYDAVEAFLNHIRLRS